MPQNRFFLEEPLKKGGENILREQEFYHLSKVMRAQTGQTIELINGLGQLAHASVTAIGKSEAKLKILEVTTKEKPTTTLILAQAIPKLNRLDMILEKITELGVAECWLFPSEGSEKKQLTPAQQARIFSITISAMKQCGSLYLPKIRFFKNLKECPTDNMDLYFGDPEGETLKQIDSNQSVIFIGPEKGFNKNEKLWFKNLKAQGVRLHDHVLRTDTAAIFSVGLFYYLTQVMQNVESKKSEQR